MKNITKHKKDILTAFAITLVLNILLFVFILLAQGGLNGGIKIILLLIITVVQLFALVYLGFTSIKVANQFYNSELKRTGTHQDELAELEKVVEEKAREADELSFNQNNLLTTTDTTNWERFGESLLISISKQIEIVAAVFYKLEPDEQKYEPISTYAYFSDTPPGSFLIGEGIAGQVVKNQKAMLLEKIPDNYIEVVSGLGKHKPNNLLFLPIYRENIVIGLIELATFQKISAGIIRKAEEIGKFIGKNAPEL